MWCGAVRVMHAMFLGCAPFHRSIGIGSVPSRPQSCQRGTAKYTRESTPEKIHPRKYTRLTTTEKLYHTTPHHTANYNRKTIHNQLLCTTNLPPQNTFNLVKHFPLVRVKLLIEPALAELTVGAEVGAGQYRLWKFGLPVVADAAWRRRVYAAVI